MENLVRLQKVIANSGYCSRRKAETHIVGGRVKVNGRVVRELGVKINPEKDTVQVSGSYLQSSPKIYVAINKPKGYVSTTRYFKGEKNVLDLVPFEERLFIVGRLDKDSEGLMILTNDGDWANKIMHPRYSIEKEYDVSLDLGINAKDLQAIKLGIKLEDGVVKPKKIIKRSATQFSITMMEGRKREIRRLFEFFGVNVIRLVRVRIGRLVVDNIASGSHREIKPNDVFE